MFVETAFTAKVIEKLVIAVQFVLWLRVRPKYVGPDVRDS
jgi:hypothetical protein